MDQENDEFLENLVKNPRKISDDKKSFILLVSLTIFCAIFASFYYNYSIESLCNLGHFENFKFNGDNENFDVNYEALKELINHERVKDKRIFVISLNGFSGSIVSAIFTNLYEKVS